MATQSLHEGYYVISSRKHIKQVIVEGDNMLGINDYDIDDALALLSLIGNPDYAHIDALCTAYGNSNINAVQSATAGFRSARSYNRGPIIDTQRR